MKPNQRKLRQQLLTYPGITEENVEEKLAAYEERKAQKTFLLSRGLSNSQAEQWLDKTGHPRPPGWSSVFIYPDSSTPRLRYPLIAAAVAAAAVWAGT